jgi:predicted ATPase
MAWYACMEAEMANLRVALRWLLDHSEGEQALRLAAALGYFWWLRGYHSEGWRWLEEAVKRAPEADPAIRVTALVHDQAAFSGIERWSS